MVKPEAPKRPRGRPKGSTKQDTRQVFTLKLRPDTIAWIQANGKRPFAQKILEQAQDSQ